MGRLSRRERDALDDWRKTYDMEALRKSVGRQDAPLLLWHLHEQGELLREDYAATSRFWTQAMIPRTAMPWANWRTLFEAAGFTRDGELADRPSQALCLYRGSTEAGRLGNSWTRDRRTAQKYANGDLGLGRIRPRGELWIASVVPERLYAYDGRTDEEEYVIDTDGLSVSLVS